MDAPITAAYGAMKLTINSIMFGALALVAALVVLALAWGDK